MGKEKKQAEPVERPEQFYTDARRDFEPTAFGKLKCTLTGHDVPNREEDIRQYVNTRAYLNAATVRDLLLPRQDFFELKENNLLFCKLTRRILTQDVPNLRRHLEGKEYKRLERLALDVGPNWEEAFQEKKEARGRNERKGFPEPRRRKNRADKEDGHGDMEEEEDMEDEDLMDEEGVEDKEEGEGEGESSGEEMEVEEEVPRRKSPRKTAPKIQMEQKAASEDAYDFSVLEEKTIPSKRKTPGRGTADQMKRKRKA